MSVLIVPDKKAVVVATHDRDTILSTIPTAKPARENLCVVPHREEEVTVLRNLGFSIPSPIQYYYNWPGHLKPMSHQTETAAFLTSHKKAIVLNGMGTGKTQSALWAADYLMSIGAVKRALIISPLSTLETTWADSIFTSFTNKTYAVLHGTAERRRRLLANGDDFCIVNHDGFEIIAKDAHGLFDLVIVDEAAALRNPSTARFKALRRYMDANPDCRLWLMTGTPTPNEPTDAWALAKLVNSPGLERTYTGFRDQVMMKLGKWKMVARPNSPEIVAKVLTPAIRYDLADCVDLPEVVYQTRKVTLSDDQKKAYKAMLKHLVVEAEQGAITAANEAVKAQKLVQIACGVAYDENGAPVELDCKPRISELLDCMEQIDGKAIIFVPLTGVLNMLAKQLGKKYNVAVVNGAVSLQQRSDIFREFQHGKGIDILLAHPATMAHGLTLTSAKAIIWYGPITSNEQYTQANARTERIGKKHTTMVIHFEATELEQRMFNRLRNKQKLQGVLLDILGEK
jgi:SNF2 family DNA or RNA helicase